MATSILAHETSGQTRIVGRVVDGTTSQPFPYVNVFANNTTFGTVTDEQGQYSLAIPAGEYEIVFSFVGYQSNKIKTTARDPDTVAIDVKLFAATRELESVTVRGRADKEWSTLYRQFKSVFLGDTDAAERCTVRNAGSFFPDRDYFRLCKKNL